MKYEGKIRQSKYCLGVFFITLQKVLSDANSLSKWHFILTKQKEVPWQVFTLQMEHVFFCKSNEYSFTSMKTVLFRYNKTIFVYNDYGTQFLKNNCLNCNWQLYISLSFQVCLSKHFTGKYGTEFKADFKYNHISKQL